MARKVYDDSGFLGVIRAGVLAIVKGLLQYAAGAFVEYKNPIKYNGIYLDVNFEGIRTRDKARFSRLYPFNAHSSRDKIVVDEHLPRDLPVMELGGGLGYLSCHINRLLNGNPQLVVEANPKNIPVLERSRELNGADFQIREGAYHSTAESVDFYLNEKFSSGSYRRGAPESITVQSFNLRKLVMDFGEDEFTLVADMEGAEFDLVENERQLLKDHCPVLIVEFHPDTGGDVDSAVEMLENVGYRVEAAADLVYTFVRSDR